METIPTETDISAIFRVWEEGHNDPHHDPIPILTRQVKISFIKTIKKIHVCIFCVQGFKTILFFIFSRLAELFEQETENYLKMDPDPFDERHPSRADPDCALGHMLKVIFRKDAFMNKVITFSVLTFLFL